MSVVFFTDRDLGLQFPSILKASGLNVERHADHFASNTRDEEWLGAVAAKNWVAVTHDTRIRYKPNELAAVVTHGARLLVVVGHAPFAELANAFVATTPKILEFLAKHPAPLIGKVYRPSPKDLKQNPGASGRVELWYPKPPKP